MQKSTKLFKSKLLVYISGVALLFLAACSEPKSKPLTEISQPVKEVLYEAVPADTTIHIAELSQPNSQYEMPTKKITNIHHTEIILGSVELKNTKISYNSIDQKMVITGQVAITAETEGATTATEPATQPVTLVEKDFLLVGTHEKNKSNFLLDDESRPSDEKKLVVKAEARCLELNIDNDLNCNHVMVDLYFLYNKKYYTEQIEVHRTKSSVVAPVAPPPAPTSALPVQKELEDQINFQQPEGNDDSVAGRYQGSAETIDLDKLFNQKKETLPAPTPAPPAPVTGEPKNPDAPKERPLDKYLSSDFVLTRNGEIRPANQASGFPDEGRLYNATSVLQRQQALAQKAYFEVAVPARKKHFATYDMAELLVRSGEFLNKQYSKKLFISDLSASGGGKLFFEDKIRSHVSHQNGLDADLGYPTDLLNIKFPLVVRMKTDEYFPKNYSIEKTYQLFKYLFTQKDFLISRIFTDKKIKKELCDYALTKNELQTKDKEIVQHMFANLQHVDGHGDHFHLRLNCAKFDPACRPRIYKKIETCGQ